MVVSTEEEAVYIAFRYSRPKKAELDHLAESMGLSRSALIRELIDEALPTLVPLIRSLHEAHHKGLSGPALVEVYRNSIRTRLEELEEALRDSGSAA